MATTIEYALMAGHAYQTTRDQKGINWFPTPKEWLELAHVPGNPGFPQFTGAGGFEAVAFRKGTEIVISYAGTNPNSLLDPDNAANIGLGTGFGSAQLLQAAEYYLQVKAANSTTTSITFTGHSLGGGLAALMGVFFGQQAVTFDQAPLAKSATLNLLTPDVAANLKADLLANGHTEAELSDLTNFLQLREVNGGIPNSNLVSTIRVDGEFTSSLPIGLFDPIGSPATVLEHGPYFSPSIDMHSQSLLTAFLQSNQTAAAQQTFSEVTKKLTDLLGMIFDDTLFEHPTNDPNNENFLERLVKHEAGMFNPVTGAPTLAPDAMVTRFTSDLWKLAQDGGLTIADDPAALNRFVSKTLIAFAMQMYYENTANATNASKELFTDLATTGLGSGGVQFDRADVAASLDQALGYSLYFQHYLKSDAFSNSERQLIQSLLPTLRDWYVQAGSGGMNVVDAHNRGAFMLGGIGADNLTGGTQTDLLVGNAGADTLNGGAGIDRLLGGAGNDTLEGGSENDTLDGGLDNDTLNGGSGFDRYISRSGLDTIEDTDDSGLVELSGKILVGGLHRHGDSDGVYHSFDGTLTLTKQGTDLLINNTLTIKNFNFDTGALSIQLAEAPDTATPMTPEIDFTHPFPTTTYTFDDLINVAFLNGISVPGNNPLIVYALGGDDQISVGGDKNQVMFGGQGNDQLAASFGRDQLFGEDGNDVLFGFDDDDELDGGIGDDELQGGLGEDTFSGGEGDDLILGDYIDGNDADYLDGGEGNDFLSGGAGDDVVLGGAGDDAMAGEGITDGVVGLDGTTGDDFLDGGDGSDGLSGLAGADILLGGSGNDLLNGDYFLFLPEPGFTSLGLPWNPDVDGEDYLDGGDGDDKLHGGGRNDILIGGMGNDRLWGDGMGYLSLAGADILDGGDRADELLGKADQLMRKCAVTLALTP